MSFLPGMFPCCASVVSEITVFGTATSGDSDVIVAPASIAAGDLIVLLDNMANVSPPTSVTPTGFTLVSSITVGKTRQNATYKVAAGTEGGTSITGMDGAAGEKLMIVFRRSPSATTAILSSTVNGQATTGDPTAQTNSAEVGVLPIVVLGCYGSDGAITTRSFTVGGSEAKDGELNIDNYTYLAYKIYNTTASTVTVDMADYGDENLLQSFYIGMS